jgi:hypothetical protein
VGLGSTELLAAVAEDDLPGRFWAEAEYLYWWMRGAALPPLITASPPGTPQASAGVLGLPTTSVLFGGSKVNDDGRSGVRFALGYWLDDCQSLGLEVGAFFLESKGTSFGASSGGSPILARPFFDAAANRPAAELVAFPGLLAGTAEANASSTGLLGADALLRAQLCCGCNYRLDLTGGYRFLRLADHLGVNEALVSTNPANPSFVPVGTTLTVGDRFDTSNEFHGFDVGLRGEVRRGPWVLGGSARVAVGDNHQVVDVTGATRVAVPGAAPVSNVGGLLALSSNIGRRERDRAEVIPEFGVKLGYQITPQLRAFAGYTFLYWGEVVRAGDQVDLAVNPGLLPPVTPPVPGPQRPAPRFENSAFWTQGVSLGIALEF